MEKDQKILLETMSRLNSVYNKNVKIVPNVVLAALEGKIVAAGLNGSPFGAMNQLRAGQAMGRPAIYSGLLTNFPVSKQLQEHINRLSPRFLMAPGLEKDNENLPDKLHHKIERAFRPELNRTAAINPEPVADRSVPDLNDEEKVLRSMTAGSRSQLDMLLAWTIGTVAEGSLVIVRNGQLLANYGSEAYTPAELFDKSDWVVYADCTAEAIVRFAKLGVKSIITPVRFTNEVMDYFLSKSISVYVTR